MEINKNLIEETKRLIISRYPRFASAIAQSNIEYKTDLRYHTAATDGKNIYFDPDYLASLNDDERIFLLAHEIMHIKFGHIFRLQDKDGNKRNLDVWDVATDAIINANLKRDGFKIKDGYVDMPGALEYSAEELYEILLNENSNNNQNNDEQNDKEENTNNGFGDDHTLWEESFENEQNANKNQKDSFKEEQKNEEYNEKNEFSKNRQERLNRAKESLKQMKENLLKELDKNSSNEEFSINDIGESKNEIDWKLLLRREVEKSETIWSQRRSVAENNYAYRLEEYVVDDDAQTEVMIDISGSVNIELVKAFLRIIKPILKHSRLKVGCFNEKFWGMQEIKTTSDIDNFKIPVEARGHYAWTEDWDLAVRSFTKKREINKIVFTDGYPCPGTMPKEDLKNENIVWIVYGNKNFKPCCGKVIHITEKQLEKLHLSKNKTR